MAKLCAGPNEKPMARNHALAARWLLAHWGLPQETIDTIWMHHQPVDTLSESDNRLASLVNLSNRLAHEAMADHADPKYHQHTETCLRALDIDTSVVDEIIPVIGQLYADRASIFDLSGNAEEFYFQALQRANHSLSSMGTQTTREHELLDRTNAILSAVNTAARKLEGVSSRKEALTTVVHILQGMGAQPGCAFLVGPKGFSGLRWDDKRTAVFSALPEELAFTLPKPLGTIAHGFAARGNGYAGAPRQVQDYLTADIFLADKRYGELIFKLPVRKGDTVSEQEALAVAQLASHLGAALERIRLADQLEERAERLTDALRKLQQANLKMMQTERLAAVGQLAAGAAHEINNPLAIIYARTQILESREPDDTKKRQFRQMMEQIERITAILNGLMDFARPAPPKLEPVSLTKIADRALSLFESGLDKHKLTINRHYDPEAEHPVVHADPGQMEPVVLNLLINAEHAMAESGRDSILDVWVTHDSSTGNGVLKVVDNGVGIEEKHIKCIFDPFFTTKEEGKGTGLGLSTSHATIRSHGGQIRVSSEPGTGTEFIVELPLAEPEQQTEDSSADTRTESPAVLVVDDEQSIRDILVEALTGAGYDAETARSGDQALHQLQGKKYKLVLLDLRMPGMDGLTFLEELKRRAADIPVLVLTGMAGEEEVERALQLGALKCLKKPFQIKPLLDEVKAVMPKRQGVAQLMPKARIVSIASGKGGAGKTTCAVNIAYALAESGGRVCLLDADLGLANVDILLGLEPDTTLEDVLFEGAELEDALLPVADRLDVLPGSSGVSRMAELGREQRTAMLDELQRLDALYDWIIVDNSPGITAQVVSMCLASTEIVVVTNPEATAITDAYALIKILKENMVTRPPLVLVNRADNKPHAAFVFQRLQKVARDYLGMELEYLGPVPQDRQTRKAANLQRPVLETAPTSPAGLALFAASGKLLARAAAGQNRTAGAVNFFNDMAMFGQQRPLLPHETDRANQRERSLAAAIAAMGADAKQAAAELERLARLACQLPRASEKHGLERCSSMLHSGLLSIRNKLLGVQDTPEAAPEPNKQAAPEPVTTRDELPATPAAAVSQKEKTTDRVIAPSLEELGKSAADEAKEMQPVSELLETADKQPLKKATIFCPTPDMRHLLFEILREEGYAPVEAGEQDIAPFDGSDIAIVCWDGPEIEMSAPAQKREQHSGHPPPRLPAGIRQGSVLPRPCRHRASTALPGGRVAGSVAAAKTILNYSPSPQATTLTHNPFQPQTSASTSSPALALQHSQEPGQALPLQHSDGNRRGWLSRPAHSTASRCDCAVRGVTGDRAGWLPCLCRAPAIWRAGLQPRAHVHPSLEVRTGNPLHRPVNGHLRCT